MDDPRRYHLELALAAELAPHARSVARAYARVLIALGEDQEARGVLLKSLELKR
jgi:hypothetical protein